MLTHCCSDVVIGKLVLSIFSIRFTPCWTHLNLARITPVCCSNAPAFFNQPESQEFPMKAGVGLLPAGLSTELWSEIKIQECLLELQPRKKANFPPPFKLFSWQPLCNLFYYPLFSLLTTSPTRTSSDKTGLLKSKSASAAPSVCLRINLSRCGTLSMTFKWLTYSNWSSKGKYMKYLIF